MDFKGTTVVLVHGAWADGLSWASVIASLKSHGVKVVAAPLPLTSLADDVAAVSRTLARIDGPVVLVGHAYAGAVIGETHSDKVKSLVYVAALAPDEGETVADVFYRAEPHPQAPKLAPDENSSDLASGRRLRKGFRTERRSRNAGHAGGCSASDCHCLHHCACRRSCMAQPAKLVSSG